MSEIDNCCGTTCDKPVAKAEYEKLEGLLRKHGVCVKCGELLSHDLDTPFADCKCGTSEWYNLTPHMELEQKARALQQKAAEYKAFIEDLMANMGAGATYDEIGDMLANWWERENGV